MSQQILELVEKSSLKSEVPKFAIGDTVDVHTKIMEGEKERWVLLYQDSLAQLWGRKSRYDDPNSAFYLEPRYREVGQAMQQGFVYWPALPAYTPTAPRESSPAAVAESTASPPKPL